VGDREQVDCGRGGGGVGEDVRQGRGRGGVDGGLERGRELLAVGLAERDQAQAGRDQVGGEVATCG
jgi:hypothetical protein